jgi:hypothetical protein
MTVQEAIHCMKFVTEEEVCEECPIHGETGTDHCFQDAHILAIEALEKQSKLERVIERLETEGKLADEERDRCARENPLHFDTAKGYATGIYNAIEIIKEELM